MCMVAITVLVPRRDENASVVVVVPTPWLATCNPEGFLTHARHTYWLARY